MRAVVLAQGEYQLTECATPSPKPQEVLIKVAYAGVNRADLFQKQGRYPLPENNPPVPGMEVSGEIIECGAEVAGWKKGDKVCALLSEGGFAEYVCAPSSLVLPVPETVRLEQAAALPEGCFTVWISFVWQAGLKKDETVLIHGGTSGIGSLAIQIAKMLGARVFTTAGTDIKCVLCEKLGVDRAINYHKEDYVAVVKEATQGKGVNVILDMVGGSYFMRNLDALAMDGRLCIIAFLEGSKIEASLSPILLKRLSVMGSTLRSRPLEQKARIAKEVQNNVWSAVAQGAVKPVIDRIFPLEEAQKALSRMEQGLNIGKILLKL